MAGTPDPGPDPSGDDGTNDCNSSFQSGQEPTLTGSRANCVSTDGAFDMVGNRAEWVADWVPLPTNCGGWGAFSNDAMCLLGASTSAEGPGALVRGGSVEFSLFASIGPHTVVGRKPSDAETFTGFRCAR